MWESNSRSPKIHEIEKDGCSSIELFYSDWNASSLQIREEKGWLRVGQRGCGYAVVVVEWMYWSLEGRVGLWRDLQLMCCWDVLCWCVWRVGCGDCFGKEERRKKGNERNGMGDFGLNLDEWNGWMDCWGGEGIGVDFAEFVLSWVESEVECGSEVGLRVEVKGSANHFQWESVRYELETGSRTLVILNAGTSGNR